MFAILGYIIIGFIVGLIARALHPGQDKAGFWMTAALGIAGALLAGFVGRLFGSSYGEGPGLISSVIGAVVLLAIWNMVQRNRLDG